MSGGSSLDEGQRPNHGPRCRHQYDRGYEHQTQQTELEHMLAHVGALSTKAKVEAGKSDKLASSAQPSPTSRPLGWSTPSRRQMRTQLVLVSVPCSPPGYPCWYQYPS